MKVEDALYHAVHDYEGGPGSLAPRMGLSASTLYSMANTHDVTHEWSLKRFRQVLAMTGDLRPLHALCEQFGGVYLPVPKATDNMPGCARRAAQLAAEFGDVARAAEDAMKDGRITLRELANMETQVFELITAAAQLCLQMKVDSERKPSLKVAG